ncbi:hypothetical protein DEU56DRAFT_962850 [Suillus clintonianus]|uniref:uncharacterized protein n=1 Tax=Suillus clintonianus TaxID=1904413 RepID=UPI001B8622CF|nr:uncharacterized protein DEU56DRAFT_962850 [Suillus clintonianus]KAG2125175.1 hypothetical protein DEU56DRAFT_962850 [Suillus clintonianus]
MPAKKRSSKSANDYFPKRPALVQSSAAYQELDLETSTLLVSSMVDLTGGPSPGNDTVHDDSGDMNTKPVLNPAHIIAPIPFPTPAVEISTFCPFWRKKVKMTWPMAIVNLNLKSMKDDYLTRIVILDTGNHLGLYSPCSSSVVNYVLAIEGSGTLPSMISNTRLVSLDIPMFGASWNAVKLARTLQKFECLDMSSDPVLLQGVSQCWWTCLLGLMKKTNQESDQGDGASALLALFLPSNDLQNYFVELSNIANTRNVSAQQAKARFDVIRVLHEMEVDEGEDQADGNEVAENKAVEDPALGEGPCSTLIDIMVQATNCLGAISLPMPEMDGGNCLCQMLDLLRKKVHRTPGGFKIKIENTYFLLQWELNGPLLEAPE